MATGSWRILGIMLLIPELATPPAELGWIDMMIDDVDEYWRCVFAQFEVRSSYALGGLAGT